MNRTYALVWNHCLGAWTVANEHARRRGKGAGAVLAAALLLPAMALAADLPTGGQVVSGSGQIGTPANNQLVIDQASGKLAINWQSFDIASGNKVTFNQPGTDSIALNRVLGADGSKIMGQLDANGRVFIINPNGVLFGQGAQVNVGGLVASTLDISNGDFEAGNYQFKGNGSNASVINNGQITAADGGAVALLGGTVSNNGVIIANQGSVALAAGNKVTLDFAGDGLLNVQVDEAVVDALVENHKLIKADGGQVLLTADAGEALLKTVVNNTGVIEAQTLGEKDGKIVLLGSFDGGTVQVAGTLDASAPDGGNGGFIETSGAHVNVADSAKVTTKAVSGKTGTWLIDPTDFTVSAGSAAQSDSGIGATTLSNNLNNTSVTLQTADTVNGTDKGDIHVNAAVTWNADTTLTLSAHNDININAAITAQSASGKVALKYGQGSADGGTADYHIDMGKGGAINLQSGQNFSTQKGSSGSTFTYNVVNDAAALQAMDSNRVNYALGSNIDLSSIANWLPVGNGSGIFTGKLAGLGHTLSHLKINSTDNYVGLFGMTSESEIRDLGLVNVDITANSNVGALVGEGSGSISNVYVTGSIKGRDDVGGLIGSGLGDSKISNAYATASVSGTGHRIGGLVGINLGAISDSYASGAVDGNNELGGLVGVNDVRTYNIPNRPSETKTGTISNSFATGNIGSQLTNVQRGGLVGRNVGIITNAYSTGDVKGNEEVGGLVGKNQGTISDTYSTGKAEGTASVGGLLGRNDGGTISRSFYTTDNNDAGSANGTGKTRAELMQAATFTGWNISSTGGSNAVWRIYDGQSGPLLRSFLQSVTLTVDASGGGKIYDGTAATGSTVYTGSSLGSALDTSKLLGSNLSYTSNSKNAGTYNSTDGTLIFSGRYSSQHGYDISYSDTSLTIAKASLSITALDASKTYDGLAWSGGNGVSYSGFVNNETAATLQGTLSYGGSAQNASNAGDHVLSASGLTSDNYDISYTAGSLSIAKASLSITALDASKTYDSQAWSGGNGVSYSGFVNNETAATLQGTLSYGGSAQNATNAGNYTLSASGLTSNNYDISYTAGRLSIAKADLAVSGISALNMTYNGSRAATLSGTASVSALGTDRIFLTGTGTATFADKNAGVDKDVTVTGYTLSGTDAGNYNLVQPTNLTATINKANLTLSGTRTYDGTTSIAGSTVTATGVNGETFSVVGSGNTDNLASKNVQTNAQLDSVAGLSLGTSSNGGLSSNYNAIGTTGSAYTVTAKSITLGGITAVDKVYDATTAATLDTSNVSYSGIVSGDNLSLSGTGTGTFDDKNVGANIAVIVSGYTLSGADAGNYVVTQPTGLTATISKADLAVTGISAVNKTYDGTHAATLSGTASVTAFGTDVVSVTGTGTSTFADKNAGADQDVTVTGYSLSGTDAGNYNVVQPSNLTATINKANLTLSGTRTYDGTTRIAGSTVTATGVNGETFSVVGSGDNANLANKDVQTNAQLDSIDGLSLGTSSNGGLSSNYNAIGTAGSAYTVTAKSITLGGITAADKVYDATTAATLDTSNVSYSGLVSGDNVSLGGTGTGTFDDKDVDTNKNVTVSGYTLSGADAGNYVVTQPTGLTATISKADLAVSGISASDKTYDGSRTATLSGTASVTALGTDVVSVSGTGTGTFADKNAGTGKDVTVTGFTLSGTDAGNYNVIQPTNLTADIDKATISAVTGITSSNKTYDGTTDASLNSSSADFTGRFGDDDLTVASASGAFADKNAADGKSVNITGITLGGEDASNYDLADDTATATADITKAALTITANDASKTQNGQAWSGGNGVSYSGFVSGEDDAVLDGALSYGGSAQGAVNAGTYTLSANGLTSDNYAISYVDGSLQVTNTPTNSSQPYIGMLASNGQTVSSEAKQQASESEALSPDMLVTNPLDERLNLQVINQGIRLPEGI